MNFRTQSKVPSSYVRERKPIPLPIANKQPHKSNEEKDEIDNLIDKYVYTYTHT